MPTALIHWFSGTGNSYHAATLVERRLKEAGYDTQWQHVSRGTVPLVSSVDLHLFTFPVYACDLPDIMARYMWKLPPGKGVKAGIIAINGSLHPTTRIPGAQGDPGWSFDHALLILRLKGYDVVLADAAPYPANVTAVIPTARVAWEPEILRMGDQRVDMLAQRFAKGERSVRHNLLLLFLYLPFGLAYGLVGRHIIGKLYVADGKCNGCGTCVKSCPTGSIRLTAGRPGWNWRCQGCMRCINACPRRAINTSLPRLAMLIAISLIPVDWLLSVMGNAGLIMPPGMAGAVLTWAFALVAFFAILYVADKVVFLLERVPLIRSVLSINHNWWFRRYLNPGFKPELAQLVKEKLKPVKRV